jgi:NAD-dependent deacetylase
MEINDKLAILRQWIDETDNIVFFGGAGVSTESGIPDFRGADGIYNQDYKIDPETIVSRDFYVNNLAEFYKFYCEKMLFLDAKPNAAHIELVRLERLGKLKAIITQNVDGLHYKAGSNRVYELHGSSHRNFCLRCNKCFEAEYLLQFDGPPSCDVCGGLVKPDVVLYGESLDQNIINRAIEAIEDCDVLIVGGTSLTVYPANGFINYYKGNKLVLINKTPTDFDGKADLLIHDSIGHALTYGV